MSDTNNGSEPAMPCQPLGQDGMPSYEMTYGLTKREMFAMAAMQSLLSNSAGEYTYNEMAEHAVNCANALLEKLEQSK